MSRYVKWLAFLWMGAACLSFTVTFEGDEPPPSAGVGSVSEPPPKIGIEAVEIPTVLIAPISVVLEEKENPRVERESGDLSLIDGFQALDNSDLPFIKEVSRPQGSLTLVDGFEEIDPRESSKKAVSWQSQDLVIINGFEAFREKPHDQIPFLRREIAAAEPTEPLPFEANEEVVARDSDSSSKTTIINFNNIGIIEYIRFVSRITGKSFLFDEKNLNFNVTVISEEPTSADNVMTTLIQTLRIHGLLVKEQGDHYMIYSSSDQALGNMARVVSEDVPGAIPRDSLIITQIFRLNTISASTAAGILKPALSSNAIIGVLDGTNQLVITDVIANLQQATQLLLGIDSPTSGMVVGQYVTKNQPGLDRLIELSEKILTPISQGQPFSLIPHPSAGSIFIVSSPFLVEKAISIMQHIDLNQAATKILDLEELRLTKAAQFGWQLDAAGNWIFRSRFPLLFSNKEGPPPGHWVLNPQGEWEYLIDQMLKTEAGEWKKGQNGNWYFIPTEEESPLPPAGEWRQARDDSWYFVPSQTKNETSPPKAPTLPRVPISPQGKWKRDVDGTWFFLPEPNVPSAAPPVGEWKRASDGIWYYTITPASERQPFQGGGGLDERASLEGATGSATTGGRISGAGVSGGPFGIWGTTPFGVLYFRPAAEAEGPASIGGDPLASSNAPGQWVKSVKGKWIFELQKGLAPSLSGNIGVPAGSSQEYLIEYGGVPPGDWILDDNGVWVFKLAKGEPVVDRLIWQSTPGEILGVKKEDKTKFFLQKVRYQEADKVQATLMQVAQSMSSNGDVLDAEFLKVLNGSQVMNSANGIIFTGTEKNLEKARELVEQLDSPVRQVFIEMLILEATLTDSLTYGVNFEAKFGGGDWSGAEGFHGGTLGLSPPMATTGIANGVPLVPDASTIGSIPGSFNMGVIGQHITHNGTEFNSIGTLINAIHDNTKSNIVMNPKILVENNSSASIFVGLNTAFKTQSISNDQGSVLTNNFEFRDVGTRFDVKATISSNDIITMDIEQEVSRVVSQNIDQGQNIGPTTSINRTKTRVHIPDGYFLIISGMINDQIDRNRTQVPCLGGFPILGSVFSYKKTTDDKRNLMIFLRPKIVETGEEIDEYTRRQQNVWNDKIRDRYRNLWDEEVEEAFDYMNLKDTDPEALPCDSCKLPCPAR